MQELSNRMAIRVADIIKFMMRQGQMVKMTDVLDATGTRCVLKLEGIEPRPAAPSEFDVVIDMDRHDQPAQRGRLMVHGME